MSDRFLILVGQFAALASLAACFVYLFANDDRAIVYAVIGMGFHISTELAEIRLRMKK